MLNDTQLAQLANMPDSCKHWLMGKLALMQANVLQRGLTKSFDDKEKGMH